MKDKANVIDVTELFRRRNESRRVSSVSPLVVEGWLLAVVSVGFMSYAAVRIFEAGVFDSVTLGVMLVYASFVAVAGLMITQGARLSAFLIGRLANAAATQAEVSDLEAYRERRRIQAAERMPSCTSCGAEYAPAADGLCPVCGEAQRAA